MNIKYQFLITSGVFLFSSNKMSCLTADDLAFLASIQHKPRWSHDENARFRDIENEHQHSLHRLPNVKQFWNDYYNRYGHCRSRQDPNDGYLIITRYYCTNQVHGCGFSSSHRVHVMLHMKSTCTFFCCFDPRIREKINTSAHPCKTTGTFIEMSTHIATCPFVVKNPCNICRSYFYIASLDQHMKDHEVIIPCKNAKNGCTHRDTEGRLNFGGDHYKTCNKFACPHECGFTGTQAQLNDHVNQFCEFCGYCENGLPACKLSSHQEECRNEVVECDYCYHTFTNEVRVTHDCVKNIESMLSMLSMLVGPDNYERLSDCNTDEPVMVLDNIRKNLIHMIDNRSECIRNDSHTVVVIDGDRYVREERQCSY